jgi:hypothetical protein
LLRAEENDRTILDLDGYLPNPHGPMAAFIREPVKRCIQGLKSSGNRVLLCDLRSNGGNFSTNAICSEAFSVGQCLIGRAAFRTAADAPSLSTQTPLNGFEEWLRLGAVKIEDTKDGVLASYKAIDDQFVTRSYSGIMRGLACSDRGYAPHICSGVFCEPGLCTGILLGPDLRPRILQSTD